MTKVGGWLKGLLVVIEFVMHTFKFNKIVILEQVLKLY